MLKRLTFRLAAVVLALTPFIAAEMLCRAFNWGNPFEHHDPLVGFSAVQSLFTRSGDRYEIPASRRLFFAPESFPAVKPKGQTRIFVLGGSTVGGRPYSIETSFTTWLELGLKAADPSRDFDVVNCGGSSYASYRLLPVLREVLDHEPDMIVLDVDHNEFLEERTYEALKHTPRAAMWVREAAAESYLITALRGTEHSEPRVILPGEVEALLDYKGGLEVYQRDEAGRRLVLREYKVNLREMVRMCRERGVEVVLVNPPCNLRDSPPFKSQHKLGLTTLGLIRWENLYKEARGLFRSDPRKAATLLEEAARLDDRYALLHFDLGKLYEAIGDPRKARQHYIRAKEEDVCPLRALEEMNRTVTDLARSENVKLFDARALFEGAARHLPGAGVPGDDLFIDHAHPTIQGHQLWAGAMLKKFAEWQLVNPAPGADQRRQAAWKQHYDSLTPVYYAQGMQRLENLQKWTAGRGDMEPTIRKAPGKPGG